jgi:hypothetical protein
MVLVWTEGQGEHWIDADSKPHDPQHADYTDGDNPYPDWGDWHGIDCD